MQPQNFDFSQLTATERVELARLLLNSLQNDAPALTAAQWKELERRQEAVETGDMPFYAWDEVKSRIMQRLNP